MPPKISYLVCSTPRTGSSLLCGGLREMGICGNPYEYFQPNMPDYVLKLLQGVKTFPQSLEGILNAGTTPNGVFGTKVYWMDFGRLTNQIQRIPQYRDIPVPEVLNRIFPNIRYIHIRRRDKIRQAISSQKAILSGVWKVTSESIPPHTPPLRYDYFSIYRIHQAFIRNDAAWELYFRRHSIQPLEIVYEDMIEAYEETLKKVLRFLGVATSSTFDFPKPPLKRLSDEINENWYERYTRTPVWVGKSYTAWKLHQNDWFEFKNRLRRKLGLPRRRKLLFVTNAYFYPESVGGSELSHLYLLKSLKKRGWDVGLMCLSGNTSHDGNIVQEDTRLGFTRWSMNDTSSLFRAETCRRIKEEKPDIVLSYTDRCFSPEQIKLLEDVVLAGRPVLCFVRNLPVLGTRALPDRVPSGVQWVANSLFTLEAFRSRFPDLVCAGVSLPFVDKKKFRVKRKKPRYITLINAIPEKGIEIATEVAARLPNENFLFVKARWFSYLRDHKGEPWLEKAKTLPNVTLWDVQYDMRRVYAVTRILLMPSQFQETFGRVIIEAHLNGIPVIASNRGGIPFALGKGGLLVDPADNVDQYVAAIKSFQSDRDLYRRFSDEALRNSRRPELDPERQVDQLIGRIEKVIRSFREMRS